MVFDDYQASAQGKTYLGTFRQTLYIKMCAPFFSIKDICTIDISTEIITTMK